MLDTGPWLLHLLHQVEVLLEVVLLEGQVLSHPVVVEVVRRVVVEAEHLKEVEAHILSGGGHSHRHQ